MSSNSHLTLDNGQRFFAIGLYNVPGDSDETCGLQKIGEHNCQELIKAKEAGFNLILGNTHGLDMCEVVNLDTLMDLNCDPDGGKKSALADYIKKYEDKQMLIWHGADEAPVRQPTISLAGLRKGYKFIKENSKHPVWLNIGPAATDGLWSWVDFPSLQPLIAACDVFSLDIYPVPRGQCRLYAGSVLADDRINCVGGYTDTLISLVTRNGVQTKPIWMVLQGFGYSDDINIPGFDLSKGHPRSGRRPTWEELRFMTYNAIIHGATGIVYYGAYRLESNSELWAHLLQIGKELQGNYEFLVTPTSNRKEATFFVYDVYHDPFRKRKVRTNSLKIEFLYKNVAGQHYLLTANAVDYKENVVFNLVDSTGNIVEVLFENRTIPMKDGVFSDTFDPYAVHLYRF